jgi:MAF protein
MAPIILASASPRRKDLLSLTGLPFIILPTSVNETLIRGEEPKDCVIRLSELKANAAKKQADRLGFPSGQVILAADTIVVNDKEIYGKPEDTKDARRMLLDLRGHSHQVLTAISLTAVNMEKQSTVLCTTEVPMRKFSDSEMDEYIKSGDPLDKAGAYAIQHDGFNPVESLSGCFASVMGLPLCHLVRELEKFQIYEFEDIPVACQAKLDYKCPIYANILTRYKVN